MKLTTYRVFRERIGALPEIAAIDGISNVYRAYEGKWWDEGGNEFQSEPMLRILYKIRDEKLAHFRPIKQKVCFFWIDQIASCVVLSCDVSLRDSRLSRIANALATCYSNAKNEFDATHDALTLLPNRQHFEDILANRIASFAGNRIPTSSPSIGTTKDVLTLLAFDLDYFKQINDTFGHQYGDVVLAAFAWRLADFAEAIEATKPLKTHVARLGGEEFQLLIEGLPDEKAGLQLADQFRQQLKNPVLPSDEEWAKISERRGISSDLLPLPSERVLSVSIGHALLTSTEAESLLTDLGTAVRVGSTLIQQADVALSRAKTDGRDCARSFREIKDRLGRVLEHHHETGIVTLDVGTEVGVRTGMEFLVFHPQFFGNHAFYQTDGRTKKRLGTYPKFSSGRLTVFEASREISFAQVIENKQQALFPVGSRLEYVPLGSFTHLVSSPLERSQANLASYDQLVDHTRKLADVGRRIVAVNMAVLEMESIVLARGTAHGNDILAAVFRHVRASFGTRAVIGMSSASEFLVLIDYDSETTEETVVTDVRMVIDQVSDTTAKCAAGIYDSKTRQLNKSKPEIAIECARLALSPPVPVSSFSETTGQSVIQLWRSKQAWDEGIADYNRLKEFGLSNAAMENAAGLCFLERKPTPDLQSAIQCFSLAVSLAAESNHEYSGDYYELNLAYAFSCNGDHQLAIARFCTYPLVDQDGDTLMEDVYLGEYARSIYIQYRNKQLKIPTSEARKVLLLAVKRSLPIPESWVKAFQDLASLMSEE